MVEKFERRNETAAKTDWNLLNLFFSKIEEKSVTLKLTELLEKIVIPFKLDQ